MRTIDFTTWERVRLLQAVPAGANPSDAYKGFRLVKLLRLSDDEAEKVDYEEVQTAEGVRFRWQDNATVWTLDIEDADYHYLRRVAEAFDHWPSVAETFVLLDKLDISYE